MVQTKELLSEFLGIYLLVFAVGCNVITGSAAWAVTSIAFTYMVTIYALAGVSRAHFNPAVSFAVAFCKHENAEGFDFKAAPLYMGAQFAGGIAGAVTYGAMFWDVFNLAPAQGFNGMHAMMAEFFYTFLLVFCVLNTAVLHRTNEPGKGEWFGMAIGFSVIAGGYGAGHISGGCFNPAVAVGIDLSSLGSPVGFGWCIAYSLAEFAAAAVAVKVFELLRPRDEASSKTKGNRLISEFLGTFFLVLTVGLNVLGGSKAPVWSIAAAFMCMLYCLGDHSGGHFNPAITMAIMVGENWKAGFPGPSGSRNDGTMYMVSQIAGGIVGALCYSVMEKGQVFPLEPGKDHTWSSAYLAEFAFTFLLCYTYLSTVCMRHRDYNWPKESFFGFVVASCIIAGGFAIGSVSGGSLNPAVSVGIAVSSVGRGHGFFHVFPYVIFELLAGAFAGVLHRKSHASWIEK